MASRSLSRLEWVSWSTPFLFFTGKGGVGKTTVASATAVALGDAGRRVLVVSTDPASNLADVFGVAVGSTVMTVPGAPGVSVMNLDPDAAAAAYRERVIGPYRGVVSDREIREIEEQLAGECTVEVAAFDQFTQLIVHPELTGRYDHVIFDTAPTGHTLRLMDLPSAWADYIETSREGARAAWVPGPASRRNASSTRPRSRSSPTRTARRSCSSAAPTEARCARPPAPAASWRRKGSATSGW